MNQLIWDSPADGATRFRHGKWLEVFERQARPSDAFFKTPIGQGKIPFKVLLSKDGLWDRLNTLSHVAVLKGEEKQRFKDTFDRIMGRSDVDWNEDGLVEVHGNTIFAWTTRA